MCLKLYGKVLNFGERQNLCVCTMGSGQPSLMVATPVYLAYICLSLPVTEKVC